MERGNEEILTVISMDLKKVDCTLQSSISENKKKTHKYDQVA